MTSTSIVLICAVAVFFVATAHGLGITSRLKSGRVRQHFGLHVAVMEDAPVIRSSINSDNLSAQPIGNDENSNSRELTTTERLGRSLRFYQSAIPVFAAYKALDYQLKMSSEVLTDEQRELLIAFFKNTRENL